MSSNPTVTIGNSIPGPSDPQVVRTTFTKIVYDSQKFWIYGEGEFDPAYTTFTPTDKGEEFYMFIPIENALGPGGSPPGVKPSFVSSEAWGPESSGSTLGGGGLRRAPSGFITANNSIMPKIIIPSYMIVDNGIIMPNNALTAAYLPNLEGLFNWSLVSLNGNSIAVTDTFKYAQVGAYYGSMYVSSKAKNDMSSSNTMEMLLKNPYKPFPPPQGITYGWFNDDSTNLVGGGAFVLMLNVVPSRPASASVESVSANTWSVELKFGEVKMVITDSGSTEVTIGIGSSSQQLNKTTVNLAEGKTKGGPPQQQHIADKDPYVILIYPVWNGIIIASGVQDAYATVFSSSYYVPKLKEAAVLNQPYSNGFDPTNPAEVLVGVGTGAESVLVNFAGDFTLTSKNCRFDVAYLPCFFSSQCWFDEWRLQSDDIDGMTTFTYNVYPIWTKNNTNSTLNPAPAVDDSGVPGTLDGTHYTYTKWRLASDTDPANARFNRVAGEILGSILEVKETQDFPIKNGNGNFDIVFTASGRGDPSASSDWSDYIQSVSVSTNIDGSSGQITVDKFGIAGQDVVAEQSIGALTIDATGAEGTVSGSIFKGLGIGISDNRTTEGATWTIPLFGLEKKLDDMNLINVPYVDGETLGFVGNFLCTYAGLIPDFSNADPTKQVGVSSDVNTVRFDWKAGTTVRAALEEIMDDLNHQYVVVDGVVKFYELDGITGLPLTLGQDWKSDYPYTKTVMYDASPDFDDMRNEIVVLGLEQIPDGKNKEIENLPTVPRVAFQTDIATTPDIPWSKTLVRPIAGNMQMDDFEALDTKLAAKHGVYELVGKTTIPGNANIRPYDKWGDFVIYGVTHNLDFKSKTWTTDLEFMLKTR